MINRPPASAKQWLLALAISSTLLLSLSACGFFGAPADTPAPQADQLQISVTSRPADQIVFTFKSSDATVISGVQSEILTLQLNTPNTSISCAAEIGDHDFYSATFLERGTVVEQATSDAAACGFWNITTSRGKVTRFGVSTSFWDRLRSLTGAPLPENYY